jgi:hypothetical protein
MPKLGAVICILGMHRSGTSLLTNILNVLGVYLGPDAHLLAPSSSNPKGYWEHQQIIKINDEILNRLGGNWYALPEFAEGWESSLALEELRHLAHATFMEDFASDKVWGWKDPRTCLTLRFWQRITGPMKYVICLRNPIDVASSLKRRDGFSTEQGVYLWLIYLQRVIKETANEERLLVFYEDLLDNWDHELQRLAQFIGKRDQTDRAEVRAAVQDSIHKKMRHHYTPIDYDKVEDDCSHSQNGIDVAKLIYVHLKRDNLSPIHELLRRAIEAVEPDVSRQKREPGYEWLYNMRLTLQELAALIPPDDGFILIDWYQWGADQITAGRKANPLLIKDGKYVARPLDDEEAIRELEGRRQDGVNFIVFGRPAFWWFDCYRGFHSYLRSKFRCALENSRLVVFDLKR